MSRGDYASLLPQCLISLDSRLCQCLSELYNVSKRVLQDLGESLQSLCLGLGVYVIRLVMTLGLIGHCTVTSP